MYGKICVLHDIKRQIKDEEVEDEISIHTNSQFTFTHRQQTFLNCYGFIVCKLMLVYI